MTTPSIISAIQKLKSLLTREEKIKWLTMIAFALCTSFLEVITATIIVIFAQVLNQPETGQKYLSHLGFREDLSSMQILLYISMICGVTYLIKNLIAASEVFYQNFSIQKMNYQFKSKLLAHYAETDYAFYLTRNSSFGSQVVGGDTEQIFSSGMTSIGSFLSESIVFVSLIAMLIVMNPALAFVILGIGLFFALFITKILLPKFYRWGQKLQEAAVFGGQNLTQFFHGFKEIILFDKRETFIRAYQLHSQKRSRIIALQTATNALPRMVIEVLFVGFFVSTIAYLCYENKNPTEMIGILGGYLYAGFRLMPGLNRMINQLNTFKSIIPSIERVHHEYNTVAKKENYLDVPEFQFKHAINLKDVSFCYPNTKKNALSHINITILKGETFGIVGKTGSGKSTLIDIALGLLKSSSGTVVIDEHYPVNSYQWHHQIGYVPQALYLIDDTIEANIAFGEKPEQIDSTRLNQAIEHAQLKLFIDELPNNVKTIVGERGIRLSGGERQRIAIARALYRNPQVLIFDEATSALDTETEAQLMETIHSVCQNRTVIMIAHRLSTLRNCDRIAVMQNGYIQQVTNYEHLTKDRLVNHG